MRELCDRPAAIITFLNGVSANKPTPFQVGEIGRNLARLHVSASGFEGTRANSLSIEGWQRLVAETADQADQIYPGLRYEIETELEELSAGWPTDLPSGIIHADLFPDNAFFIGQSFAGAIDFYFACRDALAYDLAICLNAWCFERDGSFNVTKARALVTGYHQTRPLDANERAALPLLARGSAFRFLLTRLYDWVNRAPGALVTPKDPLEYYEKLRFHRAIKNAEGYGLYE